MLFSAVTLNPAEVLSVATTLEKLSNETSGRAARSYKLQLLAATALKKTVESKENSRCS